jgi:glycosyltransferase involved in cell wall biosynthesis
VPGLDDVNFLRTNFPNSTIIYWIHGISAIYNKGYLGHINKIDYLWSPTKTVYKKIIEELHPIPFLAEFQLIPNWAESFFNSLYHDAEREIKSKYKISCNSKIFIFCGGDIKLKGWFLMKGVLWQLAQKNNTNITFFVIGGAIAEDEMYSSSIRVIHPGTLEPQLLSNYYKAAEFGLFPSLGGYEHAPVTLIEMIKCDVLPLASDVGGVKEMLGEDYPFLIDAPHSVDTWIEKVEQVLTMKEEQKKVLLASLCERMQEYKRRDFQRLLSNILSPRN